jgi:hypothetical protein
MRLQLVVLSLAALSGTAQAQGYFDFTQVPGLGDEPQVQINLNSAMLRFVSAAARTEDPEAAAVFDGIQNVRVLVYETLEDPAAVLSYVDDSSGRLEADGWERVVYIQEDDEKIRIYFKLEGERMVGMTVMIVDGSGSGEAVLINVAGDIDPAKLGQIASTVGIDGVFDGLTAIDSLGQ